MRSKVERDQTDTILTYGLFWGQVTGPKGHWSESYIVVCSGGGANPTLHTLAPHPFPSSHLFPSRLCVTKRS